MTESGYIAAFIITLVLISTAVMLLYKRTPTFKRTIKKISSEYQRDVVVPDGLDGFIELEYLLLTPHGLLVLDYRDVKGTIFPGEHLEQWPIMQEGRRTSINNPYATMKHRVTAVRGLVQDVPVEGFLIFPDDIEFGSKPLEGVLKVSELYERFNQKNISNREQLISSFKPRFNEVVNYIKRVS